MVSKIISQLKFITRFPRFFQKLALALKFTHDLKDGKHNG